MRTKLFRQKAVQVKDRVIWARIGCVNCPQIITFFRIDLILFFCTVSFVCVIVAHNTSAGDCAVP